MKRRLKAEQKEKERLAKQAAAAAAPQDDQKDVRPKKEASQVNEEELDANEFFKLRSAAVASLKEKGEHPYPHKFHVSMSLENFIQDFQHLEPGEVGFLSLGVFSNVRKHLR